MTSNVPVVLSGGSGTRLWPLSRETHPKQFQPLVGDGSLLQATWRRIEGLAGMAALQAMAGGNNPLLLVLPSDHLIRDVPAFHAAVQAATAAAGQGALVTFGIVPAGPETGYG